MGDEDASRVEAQGGRLGVGGLDELCGRHEHGGQSSSFEVGDVVHTARRAAASVGERLYHHVAFGGDLVAKVGRLAA